MTNKPFFIRQNGDVLRRVDLNYILILQVENNYVKFHAMDELAMVRTSLSALLRILPKNQFIRVDRSVAVSIAHIANIERDHLVLEKVEHTVPVSKKYYPALMKAIHVLDGRMNGKEKRTNVDGDFNRET